MRYFRGTRTYDIICHTAPSRTYTTTTTDILFLSGVREYTNKPSNIRSLSIRNDRGHRRVIQCAASAVMLT